MQNPQISPSLLLLTFGIKAQKKLVFEGTNDRLCSKITYLMPPLDNDIQIGLHESLLFSMNASESLKVPVSL